MPISKKKSKKVGHHPKSGKTETNEHDSLVAKDSLVAGAVNNEKPVDKEPWNRISSKWNRPLTRVSQENLEYCVTRYQPMIDFLDFKDSGLEIRQNTVHLPYSEERGLDRFNTRIPYTIYSNRDIDEFIKRGEVIEDQFETYGSLRQSKCIKRTNINWSLVKNYIQSLQKSSGIRRRNAFRRPPYSEICLYLTSNVHKNMSTLIAAGIDPIIASRVAQCKIERENSLSTRKCRSDELDRHYEDTLDNMRNTVESIQQPSFTTKGPYGEVLTQDCLTNADDMVMRNRLRREEDMNSLNAHVDRITRYNDSDNSLGNIGLRDDNVMSALTSLRRRQANTTELGLGAKLDRIRSDRSIKKPYSSEIDNLNDDVFLDYLLKKQLSRPVSVVDYRVPVSELNYKADTISDVQERIYNRAKEMTGDTCEARRIRERSKFLNVMDPRPNVSDFNLMILPTTTERNIDHMARSFATSGRAIRQYDVETELNEPYRLPSSTAYRNHCVREPSGPAHKLASDYVNVREAESRANERKSLLGL